MGSSGYQEKTSFEGLAFGKGSPETLQCIGRLPARCSYLGLGRIGQKLTEEMFRMKTKECHFTACHFRCLTLCLPTHHGGGVVLRELLVGEGDPSL